MAQDETKAEYNHWSIEVMGGLNKPSRPYTDFYYSPTFGTWNADLGVRYMINEKFGFKLNAGYNNIEEGDLIKVPCIDGEVGSKVTIDKILYLDDGKNKTVGNPLVTGVKINGEIISHGRERKVVVFKFKRRKGYQKKNTHRQEYSILKIGKLGKVAKAQTKTVKTKVNDTKGVSKKTTTKKSTAKKITAKKTSVKPKETKE